MGNIFRFTFEDKRYFFIDNTPLGKRAANGGNAIPEMEVFNTTGLIDVVLQNSVLPASRYLEVPLLDEGATVTKVGENLFEIDGTITGSGNKKINVSVHGDVISVKADVAPVVEQPSAPEPVATPVAVPEPIPVPPTTPVEHPVQSAMPNGRMLIGPDKAASRRGFVLGAEVAFSNSGTSDINSVLLNMPKPTRSRVLSTIVGQLDVAEIEALAATCLERLSNESICSLAKVSALLNKEESVETAPAVVEEELDATSPEPEPEQENASEEEPVHEEVSEEPQDVPEVESNVDEEVIPETLKTSCQAYINDKPDTTDIQAISERAKNESWTYCDGWYAADCLATLKRIYVNPEKGVVKELTIF